jgi:phosphatidylglycerol:prolipoprotein diacylglycerol transferase
MHYPKFDPVIFELGPLALRWYGLMYVFAFITFYFLGVKRAKSAGFTKQEISDMVFFAVGGVVLGGRFGFVLFYGFDRFLADPLWLLRIWEGGMSFHGGLLGAIFAMWLFARKMDRPFFLITDFISPLVPVGLGFGRLGNFLNTELPGRITDSALGVHYPCATVRHLTATCYGEFEMALRHVSSLYQGVGEGVVLFVIVWFYSARPRPTGMVSGIFLMAYGCLRFATEFMREPDAHIGYVAFDSLTMGQLLSLPMMVFGIFLATSRKARR